MNTQSPVIPQLAYKQLPAIACLVLAAAALATFFNVLHTSLIFVAGLVASSVYLVYWFRRPNLMLGAFVFFWAITAILGPDYQASLVGTPYEPSSKYLPAMAIGGAVMHLLRLMQQPRPSNASSGNTE